MIGNILANRYELLKLIGSGGMGNVYQAHDQRLDRIVAVKTLKSEYNDDDSFIRKFRRESLAAASISHPNIVSVYDVGVGEINDQSIYFIVMEYIDGKTLREIIHEEGVIPQNQALNYTIQIAEALRVAHSKNIVHRDIKSQNIMVTRDNRVKVTDFGIARMAGNATVTATNAVMGSVHYFSPEQARGQKVDARSDIYSLGIVLYEMLTGDVPFDSENPITVALMHVQNKMPLPSEINPKISPEIDFVVQKMTAKRPQDRYDKVDGLIDDIKDILLNRSPRTQSTTRTTMPIVGRGMESAGDNKKSDSAKHVSSQTKKPKSKKSGSTPKALLGALVAILVVAGVIFGFSKFFGPSDDMAEVYAMENFVGKPLEEAEATLSKYDIEIDVLDVKERDDVPENTILSQSVEEGTEIQAGDEVAFVISKLKESITVPNLKNLTIQEAQDELENLDLKLSVEGHSYSNTVPKDKIIEQDPGSNSVVEPGTTIEVIVSLGKEATETALVPNLKGVSVDRAKALLEQVGLALGNVSERDDNSVAVGEVVWQQYESGNKLEKGSTVDIIISAPRQETPDETNNADENENNTANENNEKQMNLNVELSNDGQDHEVQIIKRSSDGSEEAVQTYTQAGGEKKSIQVIGKTGDQFDIYVDGIKYQTESVQ